MRAVPSSSASKTTENNVRASFSSMMTEKSETLLPVISANMCGGSGLYRYARVLLDSGAQISLIHQETAEMLGLEGKNVSITIQRKLVVRKKS